MKKQNNWGREEILSLMNFVSGETNTQDALKMWASENSHRTFNAASYQFYNQLRIQNGIPTYRMEKKKNKPVLVPTHNNMQKEKAALSHKTWTEDQNRQLVTLRSEGKSIEEIAEVLHRTKSSITSRIWHIKNDLESQATVKESRTSISEYLAKHPELTNQSKREETAAGKTNIPVPDNSSIQADNSSTFLLQKGTELYVPIKMRIEGENLVITIV